LQPSPYATHFLDSELIKIVIAPDSFKESLSATAVASAIEIGIKQVLPQAQTICIPMADGGEGTLDAVLHAASGERHTILVADALGRPRQAQWGLLACRTAVIEMASAAGLEHIEKSQRNPLIADTEGVGHLIRAALDAGAKRIVLTAGGSATNDAGSGMLRTLGLRMLDSHGRPLSPGGQSLSALAHIDATTLDPRLQSVEIIIATDVRNPLCGANGASAIFGPQKGATAEMVKSLDAALAHFADLTAKHTTHDLRDAPGAGAAGGLGFAALAWLDARMRPGVEVVAELVGLEMAIADAELVITGEGRMDAQTLHGKTPWGVMQIARKHHIQVVALAGSLGQGYQSLYEHGLCAAFSIVEGPTTLESACQHAAELLTERTVDIMRLWLQSPPAH
jgi:glycerate 2-kinase